MVDGRLVLFIGPSGLVVPAQGLARGGVGLKGGGTPNIPPDLGNFMLRQISQKYLYFILIVD